MKKEVIINALEFIEAKINTGDIGLGTKALKNLTKILREEIWAENFSKKVAHRG